MPNLKLSLPSLRFALFKLSVLFCTLCFQGLLFQALVLESALAHLWSKQNLEQTLNCSVSVVISDKLNKNNSYEVLFSPEGGAKSFGSGFILNNLDLPWGSRFQGSYMYVLTKYHVVEKVRGEEILVCTEESVALESAEQYDCQKATIELLDRDYDLAVLRADFTLGNACSARFDFTSASQIGDRVFGFTNKLGLGLGGSFGYISAKGKKIKRTGAKQHYDFVDMNIGYGSSGALIFDETSRVVGAISSIYASNSNYVALMQPAEEILISLERMAAMLDIESVFGLVLSDDLEASSQNIKELNGTTLKFISKRQLNTRPEAKYELFKFYTDPQATNLPVIYTTKDNKLKRLTLTKPPVLP